jgi:WD40 repeat protein
MEHDTEAIIQAFNQLLLSHSKPLLTPSQQVVLEWCLNHSHGTYKTIAADSNYNENALRDAGCKLFAIIKSVLGKRVRKRTCGQAVREWYQHKTLADNTNLIGREADLQALLNAITLENRRLICISGPPRVGKTYLVRRLTQQLLDLNLFDTPIEGYCPQLPNVKSLHQLVLTSIDWGFNSSPPELSPTAALTYLLDTRRLLLILDKTDVLQQPEALGGGFQVNSKGYEGWLRSLLDRYSLSSCVILVGRALPRCLQTNHDLVFHLPLKGLSEDSSKQLLRQQGLNHCSSQQLDQIGKFCGYSPGILAALAHKILNSGNRDLEYILNHPLGTFHADDDLWQEALDDLTPLERELMGWLVLYPDATVKWENDGLRLNDQLATDLEPALKSLRNRGMVDVDQAGLYCIHTDWLCHMVRHNLLIELAQTLDKQEVHTLSRYPLIEPQAPLWRRQEQWQALLGRLQDQLERINPKSWTTQFRLETINIMLGKLRTNPELQKSFGIGNLLNIAVALKVPLSALKLSGLTISNADLWSAPWQGIKLTGCHLINTPLPVVLRGHLAAALSPDGNVIALGDEEGRILCWRRLQERFELFRFAQISSLFGQPTGVAQLSFGAEDMLAISVGQEVYRWWLGTAQTEPTKLMSVPSAITSLACGGDDYIAAGLQNGTIMVWHESLESTIELRGHSGPVRELAVSQNLYSNHLASRGLGDRILLWRVGETELPQREIRPERYMFCALAWDYDELVSAAYVDDRLLLRRADGTTQPLPFLENVSMLRLSPKGDTLGALRKNVVEIRHLPTEGQAIHLPCEGQLQTLAICNHGTWGLILAQNTNSGVHTVQVWEVKIGKLCWELTAQPFNKLEPLTGAEITLESCQGLTDIEKTYWQSVGVKT